MQMIFGHGKNYHPVTLEERALIGDFLKQNLLNADIPTSIFLIRMNRYLSREKNFAPPFSSLITTQTLLEKTVKEPEIKSLIYAEYISELAQRKEENPSYIPSSVELDLLIEGIAWVGFHPLSDKHIDTQRVWEMEAARNLYGDAMKKRLLVAGAPNFELLNGIQRAVLEKETAAAWELVPESSSLFRSNDKEFVLFDPIEGSYRCGFRATTLPEKITSSDDFRDVFTGDYTAQLIKAGLYKVIFKGEEYLISHEQEKITIQKHYNKAWWQLSQPPTREYFQLPSSKQHTCWHSLAKNEILLFDKNTATPEYRVSLKGTPAGTLTEAPLQRISDGSILGKNTLHFGDFEKPAFVHEWYSPKTKKLIEVDLPRFNLTFTPSSKKPEDLYCTQFPGWKLDKNRDVPSLGSCNYGLVLVNDQGKRKVILPNQELKALAKKDSVASAIDREQKSLRGKRGESQYFAYTLDTAGGLKPDHEAKCANLFLAKTLLAHRNYDEAARILYRYGNKLGPYTQEELGHLQQIASMQKLNGDASGNCSAVALYAAILALNNEAVDNWAKKSPEIVSEIYAKYLNLFSHVTAIKLSREQEISLIKDLKSA
ncbi:MAG: hypothetical protein WCF65_10180, partial [Parachlamydiaceae bacterium]